MSGQNNIDPRMVEALLHYERQALVGRLLRGVVHNLSGAVQMARLPLDLLEIQLKKDPGSTDFALNSIQEGMGRIFEELELLSAKSSQMLDSEPRDLDLLTLIKDQLAFWPADLFFKHDVKHELQTGAVSLKSHGAYCDLALAFNAMMDSALAALRSGDERELLIKLWEHEDQAWIWVGEAKAVSHGEQTGLEPFGDKTQFSTAQLGRFLISEAVRPWGGALFLPPRPSLGLILSLPLVSQPAPQ